MAPRNTGMGDKAAFLAAIAEALGLGPVAETPKPKASEVDVASLIAALASGKVPTVAKVSHKVAGGTVSKDALWAVAQNLPKGAARKALYDAAREAALGGTCSCGQKFTSIETGKAHEASKA